MKADSRRRRAESRVGESPSCWTKCVIVGRWHRHPHRARAVGPQRHPHDANLYARVEGKRSRGEEPRGQVLAGRVRASRTADTRLAVCRFQICRYDGGRDSGRPRRANLRNENWQTTSLSRPLGRTANVRDRMQFRPTCESSTAGLGLTPRGTSTATGSRG